MKAVYLDGAKNLIISETKKPEIKKDEVLIKIKSVGICGSDVLYYKTGGTKKRPITKPFILGHEVSGLVEDKGIEVKDLNIGDRVAVEPGIVCGKCSYCKSGNYNLCKDIKYLATPPIDGALVEYISHKANLVCPLPDEISYDEGALVEPSSVAFYSIKKSNLKISQSSLILGAGPIGLLVLKIIKILGSFPICVVDIDDNKLSFAKKAGADYIINAKNKDIVKAISDSGIDNEYDIVFECTGERSAISSSVFLVKKGGHISMIGIFDDTTPIMTKEIIDREITITGTYRFSNTFNDIIKLMQRGMLEVKSLITHIFNLNDVNKAFDIVDKSLENCIKVIIRIS